MPDVTFDGLTQRFGKITAVDHVSLHIQSGELLSLLGPSGCGKTTTLRLLAGLLHPSEGEIRVGEERISWPGGGLPPERRRMAMIFQSYAVWPHMTVLQNVAYGLRLRHLPKEEIGRRAKQMLAVVRLGGFEDRYPTQLSGGQQQRVSLARALVVEPKILLLDEPLSNLDANLREEMRFEIRRLHDEFGITTVYVTHDQAEAMVTADRVAVMHLGHVLQVGTPEEIYERPTSEFVARFIGKTNILDGVFVESNVFKTRDGGLVLRVANTRGRGKGELAQICLRPHDIHMKATPQPEDSHLNVLMGQVHRHIYLGDTRDYVVTVDGGITLRIIADPTRIFPVGQRVCLTVLPTRCQVLVSEA